MANQKTLLIPPKNFFAFFTFTEAPKAMKLKNLEFYFFWHQFSDHD